jgi:hypothetical protein
MHPEIFPISKTSLNFSFYMKNLAFIPGQSCITVSFSNLFKNLRLPTLKSHSIDLIFSEFHQKLEQTTIIITHIMKFMNYTHVYPDNISNSVLLPVPEDPIMAVKSPARNSPSIPFNITLSSGKSEHEKKRKRNKDCF